MCFVSRWNKRVLGYPDPTKVFDNIKINTSRAALTMNWPKRNHCYQCTVNPGLFTQRGWRSIRKVIVSNFVITTKQITLEIVWSYIKICLQNKNESFLEWPNEYGGRTNHWSAYKWSFTTWPEAFLYRMICKHSTLASLWRHPGSPYGTRCLIQGNIIGTLL